MEDARIVLADKFAPLFIASSCCHVINLQNQVEEFYYEGSRLGNLRVHVFFVSPPGYMKTLMLRLFLGGQYSLMGCATVTKDREETVKGKTIKKKVSSEKLAEAIRDQEEVIYIPNIKGTAAYLKRYLKGGEVVIILGAGDIYDLASIFHLTKKR